MSTMKLNVKTDDIEFGTNILKVKVPKQLRNKVKCGVDYIDSALGGGGGAPRVVRKRFLLSAPNPARRETHNQLEHLSTG